MNIRVHCDRRLGALKHFWKAVEISAAAELLEPKARQAMAHLGSLPARGVAFVRVGAPLDLVSADLLDTGKPWYDLSRLDDAMDVLLSNGLTPIFELAGKPGDGDYFTDFRHSGRLHAWRRLIAAVAEHLIARYGQEEVRGWYFETWHPADAAGAAGAWPGDDEEFCNYYDACSQGLGEAAPSLRLGGPGGAQTGLFEAFLNHCERGKNFFTGAEGVRLDFLSIGSRGWPADSAGAAAAVRNICDDHAKVFASVRDNHPCFADLPLVAVAPAPPADSSGDPSACAGPAGAAMVVETICRHLDVLVDDQACRLDLLSLHNPCVGAWDQPALLSCLGAGEDAGEGCFELIRTPALGALALLSLLGDVRLEAGRDDPEADVGVLAAVRGGEQVAVVVYRLAQPGQARQSAPVRLRLGSLPFEKATLAHYRIDEDHGNAPGLWQAMESPALPPPPQRMQLREHQDPVLLEPIREVAVDDGALLLEFELPAPAVSLILLTTPEDDPPPHVTGLRARRFPGSGASGQVLLCWTPPASRRIRSYEVLYSAKVEGPYRRVNVPGLIYSSLLHAPPATGPAHYKVRATDYHNRTGPTANFTVP